MSLEVSAPADSDDQQRPPVGFGVSRRRGLGASLGLGAAGLIGYGATPALAAGTSLGAVTGPGIPYFGTSLGHWVAGSNTSAWYRYGRYAIGRIWLRQVTFVLDVDSGDGVTDLASFEAAKAVMRDDPQNATGTDWAAMVDRYENLELEGNLGRANDTVRGLQALGTEIHVQTTASANWTEGWPTWWQSWQQAYLHAYYLSTTFGLRRFAFNNEPDVPRTRGVEDPETGEMKNVSYATLGDYLRALRTVSDALRCGVADGGRDAGVQSTAILHGPILTRSARTVSGLFSSTNMDANTDTTGYYGGDPRDDQQGWGEAVLKGLHVDYRGQRVTQPIIDVWDTHSYNADLAKVPDFYTKEAALIRTRMDSIVGARLPIMYSEINVRNDSNSGCRRYMLDEFFGDAADIAVQAARAGVAGLMWFKFSNTAAERAPRDEPLCGSDPELPLPEIMNHFHYLHQAAPYDVVMPTRGAEAIRLAARCLAAPSELLSTSWTKINGHKVQGSYDPARRTFQLFSLVDDGVTATFDLQTTGMSYEGRTAGTAPVVAELVSSRWAGGVHTLLDVTGGRVSYSQSGSSVVRMSITDNSVSEAPARIATAVASVNSAAPTAASPNVLAVQRTASAAEMAYLSFSVAGIDRSRVVRAMLQLYGHVPSGKDKLTCLAFVADGQTWSPSTLTWQNAPLINRTARYVSGAGKALPAGQLNVGEEFDYNRIDVTDAIRATTTDTITVIVARHQRRADDTEEFGRRATFQTPASSLGYTHPRLRLWTW